MANARDLDYYQEDGLEPKSAVGPRDVRFGGCKSFIFSSTSRKLFQSSGIIPKSNFQKNWGSNRNIAAARQIYCGLG